MTSTPKPAIHPVDAHVGRAVRSWRKLRGMNQQGLAARIGVTFQQVQKYERGANRISASSLHAIAAALEVPVGALFDGLPASAGDGAGAASPATRMLDAPGGVALATAWLDLPPGPLRHRLTALVAATAAALRAPAA